MNPLESIRLEALNLPVGQTLRMCCPFCHSVHKHKFAVTRNSEGLLYKCHRDVCGARGFIPSTVSGNSYVKEKTSNTYTKETTMVPDNVAKFLYEAYEIPNSVTLREGWSYNPYDNRLVMPIYNLMGVSTGVVVKQMPLEFGYVSGAKAMTYKYEDTSLRLHFPEIARNKRSNTCVVVEDIISATKLGMVGLKTVAILSTYIGHGELLYLASNFSRLILALDNDATRKAIELAASNSLYFPDGIKVVMMEKDPKDTPLEELRKKFGEENGH